MVLTRRKMTTSTYTVPLWKSRISVFYTHPGEGPNMFTHCMEPLSSSLLLTHLAAVVVMAFVLKAIQNFSRHAGLHQQRTSFGDCLLHVFEAICQQGHNLTPFTNAGRLVIFTAYMTAAIINNSYSGILVSLYSSRGELQEFNSVLDASKMGYQVGVVNGSHEHHAMMDGIQDPENPSLSYAVDLQPSCCSGLQKACGVKYAFVVPFDIAINCLDKVSCILHGADLSPQEVVIPMKEGSPYLSIFNHNLLRLREGGVLRRMFAAVRLREVLQWHEDWRGVGIMEMASMELILAAACVAGLLIMLCELRTHRRSAKAAAGKRRRTTVMRLETRRR